MRDLGGDESEPLRAAGSFSDWLRETRRAFADGADSSVPCDGCTACCRSSQFVHVEPDERETLARIPDELLFPAPGRPEGHKLLGYDDQGRCPMLEDAGCSIYTDRPRTCRRYDCRVLSAAGIEPGAGETQPIIRNAPRWEFCHEPESDRPRAAIRSAAAFLRDNPDSFPLGPNTRAALAIDVHPLFLEADVDPPTLDSIVAASKNTLAGPSRK
jgi:Fe-S-cluster containining protein